MEGIKSNSNAYQLDELLVYGFIRNCENLLCQNIVYYTIASELYHIVFIYYHIDKLFNIEHHGPKDGLEFPRKSIVRKVKADHNYSNCFFGEEITDKICNRLDIYIKWNHLVTDFFIGYITISPNIYLKNMTLSSEREFRLGIHDNKKYSIGIWIHSRCKNLIVYDQYAGLNGESTPEITDEKFKQGDVFTIQFNFGMDSIIVYHNDCKIYTKSLKNCKRLTPAFVLYEKHEEIEIIKCEFFK